MSYNIGQWRKNQLSTYMTDIPLSYGNYVINTYNFPGFTDTEYYELEIVLNKNEYFIENENYYLKFAVWNAEQFKVKLIGDNNNNRTMFIKSFKTQYTEQGYTECELVFTPNDKIYNAIVFEKIRTSVNDTSPIELVQDNENNKFTKIQLKKLVNIINILKEKYSNFSYIKQLGIQGPSGFIFSMNGEEFYIGKTGIYEVSGINITNLSFVVDEKRIQEDDRKEKGFFIMDFKY